MRFAPAVLALIAFAVLFSALDRLPLVDQREARDAVVTRELLIRKEVLTPVLAGEPHFEKPLPAYVANALVAGAGENLPLRSRQLRAVGMVLLLLLVASIGAEHFGPRAGWIAAIVLATSFASPLAARVDGTQVLATLLAWLGVSGFADATFGRHARGRDARLLVSWGALAAAFMVAGPMPALWPLGAVALFGALSGHRSVWNGIRPAAGVAIVLGVSLPWYGAMIERHGAAFLTHAPFFPYATEARGPWFAGPVLALTFLVIGAFPWSALLPEALAHAATWWRKPRDGRVSPLAVVLPAAMRAGGHDPVSREIREENAAHFFIACLAFALVPIALYPGPPLSAALPALPAAALLCARLLDHLFEDEARTSRALGRAAIMLGLTGSTLAVLAALVSTRVGGAAAELRLFGAFLLIAVWAPFLASFIGRPRIAALLFALPVAIGTPLAATRVLPAMQDYLHARVVAEDMNDRAPRLAPLVLLEPPPPSLRFYLRRNLRVADPPDAALADARASDGFAYVAFRPAREREMRREVAGPLEVLRRTPMLLLARVALGADTVRIGAAAARDTGAVRAPALGGAPPAKSALPPVR